MRVCVCKRERERVLLCWAPNEALSSLENQEAVYRRRETGGLGCWRQLGMRGWGKWVKESCSEWIIFICSGEWCVADF